MKKKILVTLLIVSIVSIATFCYINFGINRDNYVVEQPQLVIKSFYSAANNDSIYLKRISWGITYDKEITVLSKTQSETADSTLDYIYPTTDVFFKLSKDTLFVYSSIVSSPPKFFQTSFTIVQKELNNSEIMELRANDLFRKKGLEIVE